MAAPPRVKICGIADPAAYEAAGGADWVGFVFFPPSPRFVTPAAAARLVRPNGPAHVGLFVDPSDSDVAATLEHVKLDILQLVASPARVAAIRVRFGLPVWRTVGVGTQADLLRREPHADALLLDAKAPAGAALPGGNATTFDWPMLRGWVAPRPWVLAGGLTAHNVQRAVTETGAAAVDVSSGVERGRGIKDPALIEAFIAAARGCVSQVTTLVA